MKLKFDKDDKIILLFLGISLIAILLLVGSSTQTNNTTNVAQVNKNTVTNTTVIPKSNNINNTVTPSNKNQNVIDDYVDKYNNISNNKITNLSTFDLTDKTNDHYKTEYRLLNNAIGKTGVISDNIIDIVYDFSREDMRIYVSTSNIEIVKNIFESNITLIDKTVTKEEIINIYNIVEELNTKNFLLNNNISGYINKSNSDYDMFMTFTYK